MKEEELRSFYDKLANNSAAFKGLGYDKFKQGMQDTNARNKLYDYARAIDSSLTGTNNDLDIQFGFATPPVPTVTTTTTETKEEPQQKNFIERGIDWLGNKLKEDETQRQAKMVEDEKAKQEEKDKNKPVTTGLSKEEIANEERKTHLENTLYSPVGNDGVIDFMPKQFNFSIGADGKIVSYDNPEEKVTKATPLGEMGLNKEREEEIETIKSNQPTYLTRGEDTIDDIYLNAIERSMNTDEGKAAWKELEAKYPLTDFIKGEFAQSEVGRDILKKGKAGKATNQDILDVAVSEYQNKLLQEYAAIVTGDGGVMQPYVQQAMGNLMRASSKEGLGDIEERLDKAEQERLEKEREAFDLHWVHGDTTKLDKIDRNDPSYRMNWTARRKGVIPDYIADYINPSGEWTSARQFTEDTRQIIDAVEQDKGFFGAFGDTITDTDTWDLGINKLLQSARLKEVIEKDDKGEKLTRDEQLLLDAATNYFAVSAYYSDKLGRGYKAGQTTAASIPFMLEFVLSSGVMGAIESGMKGATSATARALVRGLEKSGRRRLMQLGGKAGEALAKDGVKKVGGFVVGVGADMVNAGLMTATWGMPKVIEGTISRTTGDISPIIGEDGHSIVYGGIDPRSKQSFSDAISNSIFDQYIENWSEMGVGRIMGEMGGILGKAFRNTKIANSNIVKTFADIRNQPWLKELHNRTKFGSLFEETMEEEVGGLLRWATMSDVNSAQEAGLDLDSQIDIVLGLAPTSLVMGGVGAASYYGKIAVNATKFRNSLTTDAEKQMFDRLMRESNSNEFGKQAHDFIRNILVDKNIDNETKQHLFEGIVEQYKNVITDELYQGARQVKDERFDTAFDKMAEQMRYKDTIRETKDSKGRTCCIVGGNVVFTDVVNPETGAVSSVIDHEKSDKKVVVRYFGENGTLLETHTIDTADLNNPVSSTSYEDYVGYAKAQHNARVTKMDNFEYNGYIYDTETGKYLGSVESMRHDEEAEEEATEQDASMSIEDKISQAEAKRLHRPISVMGNKVTLVIDGKKQKITMDCVGLRRNPDGSIDFQKSARITLKDAQGKRIHGADLQKYLDAISQSFAEEHAKELEAKIQRAKEVKGIQQEKREEPAPAPAPVATEEETPAPAVERQEQKVEQEVPQQKEPTPEELLEQERQAVLLSLPKDKEGNVLIEKMTPEQDFVYTMDAEGVEAAIAAAEEQIKFDLAQIADIEANEKMSPREKRGKTKKFADDIAGYQTAAAKYAGVDLSAKMQENAENQQENLDNQNNSSTFADEDNRGSQRLQVNITQNAAENGKESRLGEQNKKDLQDYRVALDTLRREDAIEEERTAAIAKMEEIEQRRKEQMSAMVNAALEGIDGVSGVTVNGGIGVYLNDRGEEVVEYTFSVEADVAPQSEQAFTAAMAMVAEVSKQDSFIVNYLDETSENTNGEHGSATQVRVKLDRPLTPTEKAQLTNMFSSLGLGLTITENEISSSNFSEMSDEDFDTLARYLLDGFNNGNAETTLQNARRVAEDGNISSLANLQKENAGTGGYIWSGAIDHRINYSDYNSARNNGKEGDEFRYLDKDGRETETDRYYGEYYTSADEAYQGRVPQTNLTPEELHDRVQAVFDRTEEAMSSPVEVVPTPKEEDTTDNTIVEDTTDDTIVEDESDNKPHDALDLSADDLVVLASTNNKSQWQVARKEVDAEGNITYRNPFSGKLIKQQNANDGHEVWREVPKRVVYIKNGNEYVPYLVLSKQENLANVTTGIRCIPMQNYTGMQSSEKFKPIQMFTQREGGTYKPVGKHRETYPERIARLAEQYDTLDKLMDMPIYRDNLHRDEKYGTITLGDLLRQGYRIKDGKLIDTPFEFFAQTISDRYHNDKDTNKEMEHKKMLREGIKDAVMVWNTLMQKPEYRDAWNNAKHNAKTRDVNVFFYTEEDKKNDRDNKTDYNIILDESKKLSDMLDSKSGANPIVQLMTFAYEMQENGLITHVVNKNNLPPEKFYKKKSADQVQAEKAKEAARKEEKARRKAEGNTKPQAPAVEEESAAQQPAAPVQPTLTKEQLQEQKDYFWKQIFAARQSGDKAAEQEAVDMVRRIDEELEKIEEAEKAAPKEDAASLRQRLDDIEQEIYDAIDADDTEREEALKNERNAINEKLKYIEFSRGNAPMSNITPAQRFVTNVLLDKLGRTKGIKVHRATQADVERVMAQIKAGVEAQIIGEQGAANLDKAEEVTTRLDNLQVAREMETAGKDAKAIRLATGWERGGDGKWRYEIPNIKLNFDVLAEQKQHSLVEVLADGNAAELLRAYPALADIKIKYEKLPSFYTIAEYNTAAKTITINYPYAWYIGEEIRQPFFASEISHEIQHAIQTIEGFARGGAPEEFLTHQKVIEERQKYTDYLERKSRDPKINEAKNNLLNYVQEKGIDYSFDNGVIGALKIKSNEIISQLEKEIDEISNKRIENLTKLLRHQIDKDTFNSIKAQLEKRENELREKLSIEVDNNSEDITEEEYGEIGNLEYLIDVASDEYDRAHGGVLERDLRDKIENLTYELYQSLGGEVESRNVQTRLGMTEEWRRDTLLQETEDVAREDQIFLFDSLSSANLLGKPYDYNAYPYGRVEPNLANKEVEIVTTDANHGFANYNDARTWAKQTIAKTYDNEQTGGKGDIRISNAAIDKFLSQSSVDKSETKDVHLAVLKVLPELLRTSIDVETHPDFLKGADGKRTAANEINKDVLIHRCYGAVNIGDNTYRIKITLKENVKTKETANTHSYEATKIELLDGQHGGVTMTPPRNSNNSKEKLLAGTLVKPDGDNPNTNNSISAAKLLQNVGMSYNPSVKVLEKSETTKSEDKIELLQTPSGTVYGWSIGNEIWLTDEGMNPETPIHEYTHLWATAMRQHSPKDWKKIVSLCKKNKDLWNAVVNDKNYQDLTTDDEIASEVLARFSGKNGAQRLLEIAEQIRQEGGLEGNVRANAFLTRAQEALKTLWDWVCDMLGISHFTDINEVADKALYDLLTEKAIEIENFTEEEQKIVEQAQADGTYMKAPNGKQSNLTPKQWAQTRTQAFKDWFGDWINDPQNASRCVDENGEPKVMYRGSSDDYTFTTRYDNGGYWFVDNEQVAEHYARSHADHELTEEELAKQVKPVFLNVRSNDSYDAEGRTWQTVRDHATYEIVDDEGGVVAAFDTREEAEQYCAENGYDPLVDIGESFGTTGELAERAFENGSDGVEFRNVVDGSVEDNTNIPADVWVTHDNTQAKSATENVGTFSASNKDIRFQMEDEEPLYDEEGNPIDRSDPMTVDKAAEARIIELSEEMSEVLNRIDTPLPEQLSKASKIIYKCLDRTEGIRQIMASIAKFREENGYPPMAEGYDVRTMIESQGSRANNQIDYIRRHQEAELQEAVAEFAKIIKRSAFYKNHKEETQTGARDRGEKHELTPIEFLERYLIACDLIERESFGLPTRGVVDFAARMGINCAEFRQQFLDAYASDVAGTDRVRNLWNKIRALTDCSIDAIYKGGLISEEEYEDYKRRKFYVPERDFAETEANPDLVEESSYTRRGRSSNKAEATMRAEGGITLAANVLANIRHQVRDSINKAEKNKTKQAMFNLLRENEEWCKKYHVPIPAMVWFAPNADGTFSRRTDAPSPAERKEMARLKKEVAALQDELRTYTAQMDDINRQLETATEEEKEDLLNQQQDIQDIIDDIHAEIENRENSYPYVDEQTTRALSYADQAMRSKEKVVVFIEGAACEMDFPNMVEVANALNDVYDNIGSIPAIQKINAAFAAYVTTYNPGFFAVNVVRDVPFILAKGGSQYGIAFQARFLKNLGKNLQGDVWRAVRGAEPRHADSQTAQYLKEFFEGGGNTGYSTIPEIAKFKNEVANWDKTASVNWEKMKDGMSFLNQWSEIWTRFSAYAAVREMGKTQEEAVRAAKNLSVNFNRKGYGQTLFNFCNSFSMFSNAAIQGACGFFRTFSGNKAQIARAVGELTLAPMLMGFLATLLSPDDDDDYYRISDYDRDNYWIFGDYRIPLNEQLKPFWVMGANIALGMMGRRDARQITSSICKTCITNLLPLPTSLTGLLSKAVDTNKEYPWQNAVADIFTPQSMSGIFSLERGESFSGTSLRSDYGDVAEYVMSDNSMQFYKDVAYWFYLLGGGDPDTESKTVVKKGENGAARYEKMPKYLDVNPKEVKAVMGIITPGSWGTLLNGIDLLCHKIAQDGKGEFRWEDLSMARRFYRPKNEDLFRYQVVKEVGDIITQTENVSKNALNHLKGDEYMKENYKKDMAAIEGGAVPVELHAYDAEAIAAEKNKTRYVDIKKEKALQEAASKYEAYKNADLRLRAKKWGLADDAISKRLSEKNVAKLEALRDSLFQDLLAFTYYWQDIHPDYKAPDWVAEHIPVRLDSEHVPVRLREDEETEE